jgi:hypothetical protein
MMTYTRNHNGTAVPVDSSTIHRSLSGYPEAGMDTGVGYLSIPGVPTDLLTSSFYGPADYAGTYVDSTTVMSFSHTDLVITLPTPFDEWLHIAIYTETPNASIHSSSDFSVWPASVCGTYSTSTEYSSSTLTKTLSRSTDSVTYVAYSSWPVATHILDQLQPSDPSNSLRYSILRSMTSGDYGDRLNALNATYIQAKSTQFTEPKVQALLPTGIIDWLATQEEVIKDYPYIKNCWLGPVGEGQPTVHVPVMALTATSSIFLESSETPTVESVEKESTSSLTTRSTVRTIVTVRTSTASPDASTTASVESKQSLPDAVRPESTGNPQSEIEKPDSDAVDADTEEQPQIPEAEEPSSTSSKSTASSTTGFIEGVVSAIQSAMAQQGGVSQVEPSSQDDQENTRVESAAAISTPVSDEPPAESVTGFAVGTQTASPGGEAITRGGSVYSALPSGSGLRVVAYGQTSTITDAVLPDVAVAQDSGSGNEYVVGDNTLTAGGPVITSDGKTISALPAGSGVRIAANGQTTTVPAAALPDSVTLRTGESEDEYIFAGNTLSAGDTALDFAGVTYSALKSGSGIIIIIAEDSTSTASIGQAIGSDVATEGDLDTPSPLVLPAGLQQLVTTTSVSPNTTISVQETESSSLTRGLGDAIISGMGGGNAEDGDGDANTPDPQSSTTTDVKAASHAVRRSAHVLLGGFCTFASALALL